MAVTRTGGRHREGAPGGLVHPALFYSDDETYLAGTIPFLREGLDAGHPVMVAAPPAKLDLVRAALGPVASEVATPIQPRGHSDQRRL